MNKIKILVIVNAQFGYDGISSVAINYYKYQNRNRVKMDLLTINPIFEEFEQEIRDNDDKSYILDYRNKKPLLYVHNLKKIIVDNGYDIVHIHGNSATMAVELLAAKLAGCKVRIAHSHNIQCDHQIINKILMPLFSHLYTDCCACSKEAGEFLFGKRACNVVNNGLYLPLYEFNPQVRKKIRAEKRIDDKLVIGHIGRFRFQKNQEYLVSLLKKVRERKDAVLLLVGAGETETMVRNLAKDMDLEKYVIFYGTTDKINEVVQAMDIFAFPSRFEGLGIVAIEAQASGLNCVASDAVPKTIAVQDKVKFLPLEGREEEWVDALIDYAVSPENRMASIIDTNKRLRTCGFDIEKNCADLLHYYENILNKYL